MRGRPTWCFEFRMIGSDIANPHLLTAHGSCKRESGVKSSMCSGVMKKKQGTGIVTPGVGCYTASRCRSLSRNSQKIKTDIALCMARCRGPRGGCSSEGSKHNSLSYSSSLLRPEYRGYHIIRRSGLPPGKRRFLDRVFRFKGRKSDRVKAEHKYVLYVRATSRGFCGTYITVIWS